MKNCENIKQIGNLILPICMTNKSYLFKLSKIINTFNICYKNQKNIKHYHLKYFIDNLKKNVFQKKFIIILL